MQRKLVGIAAMLVACGARTSVDSSATSAAASDDGPRFLLITQHGIVETSSDGQHFVERDRVGEWFGPVVGNDDNSMIVVIDEDYHSHVSNDHGLTWTRGDRISPLSIFALGGVIWDGAELVGVFLPENTQAFRQHIVRSRDGVTWRDAGTTPDGTLYATPIRTSDGARLFMADVSLERSTIAKLGTSGLEDAKPFGDAYAIARAYFVPSEQRTYLVSYAKDTTTYRNDLYATTDGDTWLPLASGVSAPPLAPDLSSAGLVTTRGLDVFGKSFVSGPENLEVTSLAYGGGIYVACGNSKDRSFTGHSTDGVRWAWDVRAPTERPLTLRFIGTR